MASVPAVLTSEWTKIRTVQSTVWTLLLALLITVGLGAVICMFLSTQWDDLPAEQKVAFDPTFNSFSGMMLGQLIMIIFGVLAVSTEYSTGMIRTSLAAVPQRGTFYFCKITVVGLLALVVALITSFVAFYVGQAVLGERGTDLGENGVLRAVFGAAAYMTLMALFSAGVATMLRGPMLSLGILMPFFFIISQILTAVPVVKDYAKYLPDQAGMKMMQVVEPVNDTVPYDAYGGLAIMAGWVVAALLGGFVLLKTRDA